MRIVMTKTDLRYVEQINDYVIVREHPNDQWRVRMAGAEEYISAHARKADAVAAAKRYQAADRRRAG